MARYTRALQKVFGGSASNIGTFGSAAAGSPVSGASPALTLIQSLAQYVNGWSAATLGASKFPALEDMNALDYLFSSQLAYILQQGIPEYNAATEYFTKNIVVESNTYQLYGSLVDNNTGNALSDGTKWVKLFDLATTQTINVFTGGTTTGTLNAQLIATTSPVATSFTNGQSVTCTAGYTNSGSMTFGAGGETPIIVKKDSGGSLVALTGSEVSAGNTVTFTKNIAGACWVLAYGLPVKNAAFFNIGKGMLPDASGNLSYSTIYGTATGTNRPPVAADWNQIVVRSNSGTNMSDVLPSGGSLLTTSWQATYCNADTAATLTFTSSATIYNPGHSAALTSLVLNPGDAVTLGCDGTAYFVKELFRNPNINRGLVRNNVTKLIAQWASNTTATLTADEVALESSIGEVAKASTVSVTFNIAGSGANGLDTGSVAANTWYYGFIIYNPTTGTTACLISLSATAPALPSGYVYRSGVISCFRTDGSSNIIGFKQNGDEYQWSVGNNLSVVRQMASGAAGNVSTGPTTPIAVGNFVPVGLARTIRGFLVQITNGACAAPNGSYGGLQSTNAPPVSAPGSMSAMFEFVLESSNIYWASDNNAYLNCTGFTLNL